MQAKKLQAALSTQPVYIDDVFSTYLYTGNGSTQTITNGIDLSGEGGLVWIKRRSSTRTHRLQDTVRGIDYPLSSDTTDASVLSISTVTSVLSNGFVINGNSTVNTSSETYASWTFRKQPKFFDVVTYTGTGNGNNVTVNHALESTPGFIITKAVSSTSDWTSWHRSASFMLQLNRTDAASSTINNFAGFIDNVTSTSFRVNAGSSANDINQSGVQYVAYIFAHNAGGFGLSGTDNVISCGSFTPDGSGNATVNLGYEPQWLLYKRSDSSGNWWISDQMRGFGYSGTTVLYPNLSNAEALNFSTNGLVPTATGFQVNGQLTAGATYIYIAIRRGPMKVPTDGTSVYNTVTDSSNAYSIKTTGFPVDFQLARYVSTVTTDNTTAISRLTGFSYSSAGTNRALVTSSTDAENTKNTALSWDNMTGFTVPDEFKSVTLTIYYSFRRAPGFFDVVCYTGTGSAGLSVNHNLTVPPEMVIVKRRNSTGDWPVLMRNVDRLGAAGSSYRVNSTASWGSAGSYFSDSSGTFVPATDATSTVFKVSNAPSVNDSGGTYVAYLFASLPGISKVGSYTGTGTTQQINCGFSAGARFVLIKRTDSTGDWYVWDSARGIVAGNDPYLLLNSTAAEVTNTDYVDTYSAGFEISSTAPAAINANGGSFIFLAIA